jgi:hypothetical protein
MLGVRGRVAVKEMVRETVEGRATFFWLPLWGAAKTATCLEENEGLESGSLLKWECCGMVWGM